MSSCLSIIVAKLPEGTDNFGNEIVDDVEGYAEAVELNTVTSVNVDRTMVYDEGESRILYYDHVVTIKAILTDSMVFGSFIDGGIPPSTLDPFNDRLERIYNFLSNQGLAIHFGAYPGPIRKLLPSDANNIPITGNAEWAEYSKRSGWMVDSFNGPKTLDITMGTLPGQEAIEMVWKVKYRTTHDKDEEGNTQDLTVPKMSNEVRMDIGEDGDLRVVVDGTIYADSLADLYKARDYIEITWTAQSTKIPGKGNVADPDFLPADVWAIVNGFKKTTSFNVEKNGRSAKFQIIYSQLKSNSALPYYLRDIKFEQSIESNLLGKGLGIGFQQWKHNLKFKITVPPRMNANYAWFVAHTLIMQANRRSELKYDATTSTGAPAGGGDPEVGEGKNKGLVKDEILGTYFPIRFKVHHDHFNRTVTIELDQLLTCPLTAVLNASCILTRVNNDYQSRLSNPSKKYVPQSLSQQNHVWQTTTERGKNYDVNDTKNGTVNPRSLEYIYKPHRDTAGTEIVDGGQGYDGYRDLDEQTKQRVLLVTNIYDAQDKDIEYPEDEFIPNPDSPSTEILHRKTGNYATLGTPENAELADVTNNYSGKPGTPATVPFSVARNEVEINPRASWVSYKQDYELLETNPVLPVEGLADVSISEFQAPEELFENAGLNDTGSESNSRLGNAESIMANTNNNWGGRSEPNERNYDSTYVASNDSELSDDENALNNANAEDAFNKRPVMPRRTYAMTAPRYYLKVRGHAIRAKYKVPIPAVLEIAGQRAIRVGTGRFKHSNLAAGGDYPVYLAMWEQTYTIDKSALTEDILNTIQGTGASVIYS